VWAGSPAKYLRDLT
jgi:hypothetical protein